MKKLYCATQHLEAVYLSEGCDNNRGAIIYLGEERDLDRSISIEEITHFNQTPEGWRNTYSLIWGAPTEMTVEQYFGQEYQTYLQLKEKFETK